MKLLILFITVLGIFLPGSPRQGKRTCKKPALEKTSFQLIPGGLIIHI